MVLLVENENSLGELLLEVLNEACISAHLVLTAQDAYDFIGSNGAIDLVITDLHMGQMSGAELFQKVERTIPVKSRPKYWIISTGSLPCDIQGAEWLDNFEEILYKPFPLEKIVEVAKKYSK